MLAIHVKRCVAVWSWLMHLLFFLRGAATAILLRYWIKVSYIAEMICNKGATMKIRMMRSDRRTEIGETNEN